MEPYDLKSKNWIVINSVKAISKHRELVEHKVLKESHWFGNVYSNVQSEVWCVLLFIDDTWKWFKFSTEAEADKFIDTVMTKIGKDNLLEITTHDDCIGR